MLGSLSIQQLVDDSLKWKFQLELTILKRILSWKVWMFQSYWWKVWMVSSNAQRRHFDPRQRWPSVMSRWPSATDDHWRICLTCWSLLQQVCSSKSLIRWKNNLRESTLDEEITCQVLFGRCCRSVLQIGESQRALIGRWGTGSTPLLITSISAEFLLQENRIYICSYADRHWRIDERRTNSRCQRMIAADTEESEPLALVRFLFSSPEQLNSWPCHSLTHSLRHSQYFYLWQSDPRDLWPLRHLIKVMRRHDLTKKTKTKARTKTKTMLDL